MSSWDETEIAEPAGSSTYSPARTKLAGYKKDRVRSLTPTYCSRHERPVTQLLSYGLVLKLTEGGRTNLSAQVGSALVTGPNMLIVIGDDMVGIH